MVTEQMLKEVIGKERMEWIKEIYVAENEIVEVFIKNEYINKEYLDHVWVYDLTDLDDTDKEVLECLSDWLSTIEEV